MGLKHRLQLSVPLTGLLPRIENRCIKAARRGCSKVCERQDDGGSRRLNRSSSALAIECAVPGSTGHVKHGMLAL